MELKKREWLVKNGILEGKTPKEHFKSNFKELLEEISNNENRKKTESLTNV